MFPVLHAQSNTPLYEQLYHFYKDAIHNRILKKGERLPSVRKLAAELCISNNTIVKCYQQLTDEGYVINVLRKGLFVADIEALQKSIIVKEVAAPPSKIKPTKIKYNLGRSVVDENRFPMRDWRRAQQLALDHLSFQYVQYDFDSGTAGLKEQLTNYLYRTRGITAEKEQIVVAAGTNSILILLALIFKAEYRKIIFEEPGFEHARFIFEQFGYAIDPVNVNKNGIDITQLRLRKKSLAFLTPTHHYPTGCLMPTADRIKVLNWATTTDSYIIEDDYDSIFRHKNKPIPPLKLLDKAERVIYIGTVSKQFIPSLRIAFMVLPKALVTKINQLYYLAYSVPYQTQRALAIFMEKGYLDRHVRRMQKSYKEKYYATLHYLKIIFGNKISILESEAGLSILIEVKTKLSEEKLIELAKGNGIAIRGAAITYFDKKRLPVYPQIFIGFGNISLKQIPHVLALLEKSWC